jgi:prepilin-type N-terminal cleavage/methylation domain-containing protein
MNAALISHKSKLRGFTVVELLIVIVLIVVLATVTSVAYRNQQKLARDTIRKNDVARIAEAIELYAADKNNLMGTGSGCGNAGNGNGYVAYTDPTNYPKSIETCLMEIGLLEDGAKDPKGPNSGTSPANQNYAYMKYNCTVGGVDKSYVFAKLETLPQGDVITDANVCNNAAVDTSWGMNYYTEVK